MGRGRQSAHGAGKEGLYFRRGPWSLVTEGSKYMYA